MVDEFLRDNNVAELGSISSRLPGVPCMRFVRLHISSQAKDERIRHCCLQGHGWQQDNVSVALGLQSCYLGMFRYSIVTHDNADVID